MPLFHYKALTASGESIEGEMEAADTQAVVNRLYDEGQIPVHTEQIGLPGSGTQKSKHFGSKRSLSSQEVSLVTSKLAVMLRAGLPLDHALELLTDLIPVGPGQQTLERIRADVQNGTPLSDAMQAHPQVFNKLYVNTLKAGETAGALETVLEKLADYLERSRELKETVKSALIYPAILFFVALISLAILMVYVVPQFSDLFEGMEQAMPLPTAIVIKISEFVQHFWWLILLSFFLCYLGIKLMLKNPKTKRSIDRRLLNVPLVSDLIQKVEVARFSRTLGTLTGNGVPLLTSLNIVSETVNNKIMAEALESVSEQLREGKGMAKPLAKTGIFPQLAVQLIHVGEETGELEKMLNELAEIYDTEVKETVQRLLALLEPALIIGLGIIIAGIIISILLAILGLNEFVV